MKKSLLLVISLLLVLSFVTGCSKDTPARDVLINGIDKSKEINSSSVEGNIKATFNFDGVTGTSEEFAMLQMIPEINIDYTGNQVTNPMQLELNLKTKVNVKGTEINVDLPMIIKDNMLYFQLPEMYKSQLQMIFPEFDASKNYLAIEMGEALENYDDKQAKIESTEMLKSILSSIEDRYLVKEEKKDYTITDSKVSEVITILITQENMKPFVKSIVKDGLPVLLKQMLQYTIDAKQKQQLEDFKINLASNTEKINLKIEELDKSLTINNLSITNVFDKNGFNRKTLFNADVKISTEELGTFSAIISMEQRVNNINKEITFKMPIPTKEEVITTEELEAMFNVE